MVGLHIYIIRTNQAHAMYTFRPLPPFRPFRSAPPFPTPFPPVQAAPPWKMLDREVRFEMKRMKNGGRAPHFNEVSTPQTKTGTPMPLPNWATMAPSQTAIAAAAPRSLPPTLVAACSLSPAQVWCSDDHV